MKEHQPPPSAIIFSGGGYQGFWRLDEPVVADGNIDELEAYNIGLEQRLGGDHCHNIDRIMRVPGTMNIPDAKKRAAGRIEALAEVVYFNPNRVYSLADFTPYQPTDTRCAKTGSMVAVRRVPPGRRTPPRPPTLGRGCAI